MNESERINCLPREMTPLGDQSRGEWYVSRVVFCTEWEAEMSEYLHHDGVWRSSTYTIGGSMDDDKPTGYFASEAEAKAALAEARGKDQR